MIGEVVAGRYRLVELIGEGATGAVYRAEDQEGKGTVAVKVLRQKSGTEAERRLEREAVAAGKLDHPNLVAVRDFGALDDGRPYLVMDLIEGRSLAKLMEGGRLPADRALRILAHVLRGLDHAHTAGVVHRDLRPDDILLVDRDGDPDFAIIVDFGTAALLGAAGATAEQLTRAGAGPGTPDYLAPERLDVDAGPADARADLYAATCILFEMLTGSPPYGRSRDVEPQDLLKRHANQAIPEVSDADAGLAAIVARGLAKKPADRFATAAEYLTALEAQRAGKLDPDSLGKPAATPAGKLAEPDPSKATTVFHGAPVPAAPSPVGSSAAALEPPAIEPSAAGVSPDAAGPRHRWRLALVAGAALAAIVIAIAIFAGGDDEAGRRTTFRGEITDPMDGLIEAWQSAGLEPGDFKTVPGDKFAGGDCRTGKVSTVDVTVCLYSTVDQARKARRAGLRAMRGVSRTAIPSGKRLLIASRGRGADPKQSLDKVTAVFRTSSGR